MECKLRVSGIVDESIVDGPGLRFVVFTQGCPHHCPGCHNPQTHSFSGGSLMSVDEIMEMFCEDPLLSGMTFSGGEPFSQPEALSLLGEKVKAAGKNLVIYTGYTIEELLEMCKSNHYIQKLLMQCDLLIDGPFIESLKDADLLFRGSSNQRLLNLTHFPEIRELEERSFE